MICLRTIYSFPTNDDVRMECMCCDSVLCLGENESTDAEEEKTNAELSEANIEKSTKNPEANEIVSEKSNENFGKEIADIKKSDPSEFSVTNVGASSKNPEANKIVSEKSDENFGKEIAYRKESDPSEFSEANVGASSAVKTISSSEISDEGPRSTIIAEKNVEANKIFPEKSDENFGKEEAETKSFETYAPEKKVDDPVLP